MNFFSGLRSWVIARVFTRLGLISLTGRQSYVPVCHNVGIHNQSFDLCSSIFFVTVTCRVYFSPRLRCFIFHRNYLLMQLLSKYSEQPISNDFVYGRQSEFKSSSSSKCQPLIIPKLAVSSSL